MVFASKLLIGMSLLENCILKNVVCDLELWMHDLRKLSGSSMHSGERWKHASQSAYLGYSCSDLL